MESLKKSPSAPQAARDLVEDLDVVILGGGTGSTIAAWTLAAKGQRVAVVDRKYIGGSCPNIACLPSKNIIHSAKIASYLGRADEFGMSTRGFTVDMKGVRQRKRAMVKALNEMYLDQYRLTGAELILGSGRFVAPRTIEVTLPDGTRRRLRGTNVIVSTGTHATIESIPGLSEAQPLTHIEALELDEVPDHLIVLGGGYVGVELSQAMRRFGSKVTIVTRGTSLLRDQDDDVTDAIRNLMDDEGIAIVFNAKVEKVSGRSGERLELDFEQDGVNKSLTASHILVATGRTPNTQGLELESAGIEVDERGYLKVNERLQTSAPGVWAIGEVAGSPQFTHVSVDDSRIVLDNLMGRHRVTSGRQVPFCLFTDPELAQVGLNEKQATRQGIRYRRFKVPMDYVLRARALSETRGFLKALVEADSDRILGFTAFGTGGGEIMSAVQIAMLGQLPYTALRDAVLTHPTLVEGLTQLFSAEPTQSHLTAETKFEMNRSDRGAAD